MNVRPLVVFLWVFLIGTAAAAGEERRTRIEITVDDDTSGERAFVFDSQEAGFDLHSLAVGESRTFTDRTGSAVDVRRTADGFVFDADGRTVEVDDSPAVDGVHAEHEIDVRVDDSGPNTTGSGHIRTVKIIKKDGADGVTIISGSPIDTPTRERIQEALKSSGHAGEVQFIDGSQFDADGNAAVRGRREVRVIKKEVEVTEE